MAIETMLEYKSLHLTLKYFPSADENGKTCSTPSLKVFSEFQSTISA